MIASLRRHGLLAPLCLLTLSCANAPTRAPAPEIEDAHASPRVDALFAAMREGAPLPHRFPPLHPEDIPALLARAASTEPLRQFPRNPLSSQFEDECAEGMVALWLIEGVRIGGTWPSLCALCFDGKAEGSNWTALSAANHPAVLAAYTAWWDRVGELPPAEAAAIDPLAGTGLHWY